MRHAIGVGDLERMRLLMQGDIDGAKLRHDLVDKRDKTFMTTHVISVVAKAGL